MEDTFFFALLKQSLVDVEFNIWMNMLRNFVRSWAVLRSNFQLKMLLNMVSVKKFGHGTRWAAYLYQLLNQSIAVIPHVIKRSSSWSCHPCMWLRSYEKNKEYSNLVSFFIAFMKFITRSINASDRSIFLVSVHTEIVLNLADRANMSQLFRSICMSVITSNNFVNLNSFQTILYKLSPCFSPPLQSSDPWVHSIVIKLALQSDIDVKNKSTVEYRMCKLVEGRLIFKSLATKFQQR